MASLKGQNNLGLYGVMALNLAVFYGVVQYEAVLTGDWVSLIERASAVIPAGVGLVLTGVLNAQLSSTAKARILFLRWRDPLPGSEAFSKHGPSDARVDMAALEASLGPLPTAAREQNALWYKLYTSVSSNPAVTQVHRAFLFARDYAGLAGLAVVVLAGRGRSTDSYIDR